VGVACFDGGTEVPLVSLLLSFVDDDADGRREEVNWARIGLENDLVVERSETGFEMCGVTSGATTTFESGLLIAKVCLRTPCGEESNSALPSCVDLVRPVGARSLPLLDSPLLALCREDVEDGGGVGYGADLRR
jgi:hypothetical protein